MSSHPEYAEREDTASSRSSSRRVWQRNASRGSSRLSLQAMSVLYDAGVPLTRQEIADRLLPLLDAYARSYLEARYLHLAQLTRARVVHHRGVTVAERSATVTVSVEESVRSWLTDVFLKRASQGATLIRDADGRFRPGPKAPSVLTLDGRLIAFTPEARRELAQTEHDQGHAHLALVEWDRITQKLDLTVPGARVQMFMLLARRLLFGKQQTRFPLDERTLSPQLETIVRHADTVGVQRLVLQRAFDALWEPTPTK